MGPLAEYVARRDRLRTKRQKLDTQFNRLGYWKLAAAIVGAAILFLTVGRQLLTAWWLAPALAVFAVLIIWHKFVAAERARAERAARFYDRGIERLEDRWIGKGNAGERFRNPEHVYTEDLDVFGKGSLFELIAITRTAGGERTLADWLRSPAPLEEAVSRQQAVHELAERLDLREEIALLGAEIRSRVHETSIEAWGAQPRVEFPPFLRVIAFVLALLTLASLVALLAHALPRVVFLALLACNFTIAYALRGRVGRVLEGADTPGHELGTLSLILERLEHENFASPRLREICSALEIAAVPASRRIAQLERWVDLLDSSDHLLIRLLRPVVLWREQIAMGIENWRRRNGRHLAAWVKSVADFEALSSLASLKFERPDWNFPALLDGEPCFEARQLRHPLIAPSKCVANDVAIGGERRVLIVSGSNMSGKSTLLRAIGLNTVLAWTGGPVAAAALRVSSLEVGASIRAVDSLQENRSRFYAEILRIRTIAELARERRVLFLLDELLSGTNSHDRRIGAAGIVHALVKTGAIGLVTTHDLALADMERELGGAAVNVHFDDQIANGEIRFDYRLKPGVVTRSNALELMRAAGLEV